MTEIEEETRIFQDISVQYDSMYLHPQVNIFKVYGKLYEQFIYLWLYSPLLDLGRFSIS
jgi:hypothetical protein